MATALATISGGGEDEPVNEETLGSMFLRGLELHDKIQDSCEDSRSESFQNEVRKGIMLLEDVTRMVSVLDLFSRNESVSEVSTQSLKFFLLPVLLGNLNSKLQEDMERRLEVIRVVQTYYMDFLHRIKDYGIVDYALPEVRDCEEDTPAAPAAPPTRPGPPDLSKMNAERDLKMRRYKEKRQLEDQIKELRRIAADPKNEHRDDEVIRKFYMSLIKSSALHCLEEIASYEMEKPVLAHMAKVKKGEVVPEEASSSKSRRPLKPIIITKDRVQKEVFGMGYKNLPVLSIEEFYEQRVRDGWFPDPAQVKANNSLMDKANQDPDVQLEQRDEEERVRDDKEDRDDEEELQRKRNWDEYLDEHKRGEGNMHNKG